jgi:hypothetical protein
MILWDWRAKGMRSWLLSICVFGAVLVSCQTDPTVQAQSNPCSLVSTKAVESITGRTVASRERVQEMVSLAKNVCSYKVGRPFRSVNVYLKSDGIAQFRRNSSTTGSSAIERIPDIGDEAYLQDGQSANALVGRAYIAVFTQNYTRDASRVVKELLRRAVDSLTSS